MISTIIIFVIVMILALMIIYDYFILSKKTIKYKLTSKEEKMRIYGPQEIFITLIMYFLCLIELAIIFSITFHHVRIYNRFILIGLLIFPFLLIIVTEFNKLNIIGRQFEENKEEKWKALIIGYNYYIECKIRKKTFNILVPIIINIIILPAFIGYIIMILFILGLL